MTRRTKIIFLVVAIIVVLVAGAITVWALLSPKAPVQTNDTDTSQTTSVNYASIGSAIKESGSSDEEVSKVVANYGSEYTSALKDINDDKVVPEKWTTQQVNQVYFSIVYADKIKAYSQVQDLYYQIAFAKENGVNVDANSLGVTQADLDAMKARVDAAMASVDLTPEIQR